MISEPALSPRPDLRSLSLAELQAAVSGLGLPEYRFRQIARWLFDRTATSFDEMTDLSLDLRAKLDRRFRLDELTTAAHRVSKVDGSEKFLFRLEDGASVESVLMTAARRITLCVSTQVGCTLDCVFCQTAGMGFERNLNQHEILGQILPLWRRVRDRKIRTNIVFMGMGEPLHNVDALLRALRILQSPLGLNFGPRRLTISTAGVLPGIRKLAASGVGVGLAISLNATTEEVRARLMPRAARTPIPDLMKAAAAYARDTKRRVTVEYVLIRGINDSDADAKRLMALVRNGPFKVNLIPYNPGASPELKRPDRARVDEFATILLPGSPAVTVRWSMGPDISAACGQLCGENAQKTGGADLPHPPKDTPRPRSD
ncbi:MAG: 23S rRNA (adenine(2503)-C(2))-methyltransferase RlmN [Gemmatimonadota bacterium]|nr:23S rRNA (adenine(2503)-C(2))-methyltransferase RlmN [Gemmatimonadota bacterium]MDP6529006.1 23S rRNA (adenine(2503)-C(2))-methyltransferase RlmN [Gemmatimonadota bacterium]